MDLQATVQLFIEFLVNFATSLLLPTMIMVFLGGMFFRALIYFTVQREMWFAKEFQRRVEKFIVENHDFSDVSFFMAVKRTLEKTFYEIFIVRAVMKRRRPDYVMSVADRVFLIQQGAAFLVRDTIKQIKFLQRSDQSPKLLEISKNVLQNNPCFNKVFGIIPINVFNDILNILPGLFLVGGIFGTFLGIMQALPELQGMDLEDVAGTKEVMDAFLTKISFSMSTSIIGILLSVLMNVFNTFLHPEKLFINIVEKYENSLDILWNRSTNNLWEEDIEDFDEHKDPLQALAEDSLSQEIEKASKKVKKNKYREINVKEYDIKNALTNQNQNSEKTLENRVHEDLRKREEEKQLHDSKDTTERMMREKPKEKPTGKHWQEDRVEDRRAKDSWREDTSGDDRKSIEEDVPSHGDLSANEDHDQEKTGQTSSEDSVEVNNGTAKAADDKKAS